MKKLEPTRWMTILLVAGVVLLGAVSAWAIGIPHPLFVNVQDGNGSSPGAGDLTFEAWLTKDPASVLTESSPLENYGTAIPGYISVNAGNFATAWTAGDIVRIEVEQTSTGYVGTGEFTLDTNNFQMFAGASGIIIAAPFVPPSPLPNVVPLGDAGEGSVLNRGVLSPAGAGGGIQGEDPPRLGGQPLCGIYEVGEPITGSLMLTDPDGAPIRNSFVLLDLYKVDISVVPYTSERIADFPMIRYDRSLGAYAFSIDTTDFAPGCYDLRLAYSGIGPGEKFRIQLIEPATP